MYKPKDIFCAQSIAAERTHCILGVHLTYTI